MELFADIAASKSQLYRARTLWLCSAAVDVSSNMNSGAFGVLHCVVVMSRRIPIRFARANQQLRRELCWARWFEHVVG